MENSLYSAEEWIKRAESNFTIATSFDIGSLSDNIYLDDLCFELQQSVEKAIKAILVKYGINFPKTNDIDELLKLLKQRTTILIPSYIVDGVILTPHAITSRYPNWNTISDEEIGRASCRERV